MTSIQTVELECDADCCPAAAAASLVSSDSCRARLAFSRAAAFFAASTAAFSCSASFAAAAFAAADPLAPFGPVAPAPPDTEGGGGGAAAPARKHALGGGAPGMWAMAPIAICTRGAESRAIAELRRDLLPEADRVAEELAERFSLPAVESGRLSKHVRVRRWEVGPRIRSGEVQVERAVPSTGGVAERDGDVVLVGLGEDSGRVLQRRDRKASDLGVTGRDVGDRVPPRHCVGHDVGRAVRIQRRRGSSPALGPVGDRRSVPEVVADVGRVVTECVRRQTHPRRPWPLRCRTARTRSSRRHRPRG